MVSGKKILLICKQVFEVVAFSALEGIKELVTWHPSYGEMMHQYHPSI